MATLMLQIIETRILSVVSMYYMAFLSISMAMLGMTAGAILVYLRLDEITPENVAGYLSRGFRRPSRWRSAFASLYSSLPPRLSSR